MSFNGVSEHFEARKDDNCLINKMATYSAYCEIDVLTKRPVNFSPDTFTWSLNTTFEDCLILYYRLAFVHDRILFVTNNTVPRKLLHIAIIVT